ncbi:methyltransferase type 11 [Methyloprofundus sedimenti]|uniref:Methyltransferase type 11 n=1 Tax=Methyloprofundus sedimenti TaxID=1420851 RepID=A0A1V8M597_9GAMM|nr:class I SAM-dependent methyltransferase [Methyloprofundus sedimenti]OQK16724.1 methyltransferase type 11 [Methyloprofundus sedimenti]
MAKTPLIEEGLVVGTGSDKYETKNPLAQYLLRQFDKSIAELVNLARPDSILEVGCGEGHVTDILLKNSTANIQALDISQTIVDIARDAIDSTRVDFQQFNIYDLAEKDIADLVVCCEVLEHLETPETGLLRLAEKAAPYAIISVPREPLWRLLNFMRGAHVSNLGNSPGHIQHWSQKAFIQFVETQFEIVSVKAPLPWTVLLLKSRQFNNS